MSGARESFPNSNFDDLYFNDVDDVDAKLQNWAWSESENEEPESDTEKDTTDIADITATPAITTSFKVSYTTLHLDAYFLAKGSFGKVYKGSYNGKEIAIKDMVFDNIRWTRAQCDSERAAMQFLTSVQTPNIVNLVAYAEFENHYSIAMEYMPRGSLTDFMCDRASDNAVVLNPWPWSSRYTMMLEITKAIAFMHAHNMGHRDIKSDNILLDADNHARLSDFGFSKIFDNNPNLAGSYRWLAPEIIVDKPPTDKTDIYSLCVLFWEMAVGTGLDPYNTIEDNKEICLRIKRGVTETIPADCPLKVAKLITWGWKRDPALRPSAAQVLEELSSDIDVISERLNQISVPGR